MSSYFETLTTKNDIQLFSDYRPDNEFILPQIRQQFSTKINTWLCTDNGKVARNILNTIEYHLKKYKFGDKYQLREDIIYLLYKSQ